MKKLFAFLIFGFQLQHFLYAQNTLSLLVKNKSEKAPLCGAIISLSNSQKVSFSDSTGFAMMEQIPDGPQIIVISSLGYYKQRLPIKFPLPSNNVIVIELEEQSEEMEEVIIVSSRNNIAEEKSAKRVEVIGEDEVEERSNDKPSDVSHVVREQPGVQVQRTSATSGTMN
ncbi:MAG: carboxypeptidase-like regulatory domain-containing protein, partial [Chitinophagales bacterium]|nr:carboxypeptidase-like regulatory domain-containing protein [Chitinophagales bacterium]